MRKYEDFSDWYSEVIEKANLVDKRYPIKGMDIWTAYGWKVMSLMDGFIRKELDATDHQEVRFPTLIPEDEFAKEAEHIKGFESSVYWVTHAGLNPLDVRLLLRPTSETAMYPVFALWIRSHSDLPLKTYQIVEVFRYETKQTRTFMRVREIHFFESHTCHASYEEAEEQIKEDLEIMDRLARIFCIPYVKAKRPDWDKFAGAYYTIGIDSLMPTGRTIQNGGIHQYRDNFARAYDITFEDIDGSHKFAHQTTFGLAERLLGAVVALHGDDKGIILPPMIAPIQVVVIPILEKGVQEEVLSYSRMVHESLASTDIRVFYDDRDIRPGSKFYEWEQKGVPIRIEIGPKEVRERNATLVLRHDSSRETVGREGLANRLHDVLARIQRELFERASTELEENTYFVEKLDDMKRGIAKVGWCLDETCGHEIENRTDRSILGTPYEGEEFSGKCIICGKNTKTFAYVARTH